MALNSILRGRVATLVEGEARDFPQPFRHSDSGSWEKMENYSSLEFGRGEALVPWQGRGKTEAWRSQERGSFRHSPGREHLL